MNIKKLLIGTAASAVMLGSVVFPAFAATIITFSNPQGWSTADTRPGGAVNFVVDATTPSGAGALQLTTDATNAAKAQYMHETQTPIADITELSYYTKQNSASFAGGDPSYQLVLCLGGLTSAVTPTNPLGCTGFTTMVYEPYENGTVTPGVWESWDVDAGQMWSSRSFTDGDTCTVSAGAGGAPFYTLSGLQASCPDAVAIGFGVNVGSYNPSYDVETDLVSFNGDAYDFEPDITPGSDKNACKNGGWMSFNSPSFKNQGACVSYITSNEKAGKRH